MIPQISAKWRPVPILFSSFIIVKNSMVRYIRKNLQYKLETSETFLVHGGEMHEARGLDLTSVWSWSSVGNQVDTEFTLWCFDRGESCAWWYLVTLSPEFEVMNNGLHVVFHWSTKDIFCQLGFRFDFQLPSWWSELSVVDLDITLRHLIETLKNDANGLAHLLHSANVAIVAITAGSDWNIKLDQIIGIVGWSFSQIPLQQGLKSVEKRIWDLPWYRNHEA